MIDVNGDTRGIDRHLQGTAPHTLWLHLFWSILTAGAEFVVESGIYHPFLVGGPVTFYGAEVLKHGSTEGIVKDVESYQALQFTDRQRLNGVGAVVLA